MVLEATRKEPMPSPPSTPRSRLHTPEHGDQTTRRDPGWMSLGKAFDAERIRVETAVGSEDPELIVVIEVAQSVDTFLDKVENVEGLEFLFEDAEDRLPDDDFHLLRKKKSADEYRRTASTSLASTVYFVFTDAAAVRELLSMWARFKDDRSRPLPQPWKRVFTRQVEDVRAWGPQDRLTQSLDEAVQAAEWERIEQISVEVDRAEVHNDAAVRGTVQHELLEGTDAPVFGDGDRFGVSVTARARAGALQDDIRFGLVATLETGMEAGIAVREQMRERVRVRG